MNTKIKLISVLAVAVSIFGCQTSTSPTGVKTSSLSPQSQQVLSNAGKVLGPVLVQTLFAVGEQELSGQKISKLTVGSAVANSLWVNINNVNSTQDVKDLVGQSVNAELPKLANAAASAFLKSQNPDNTAKVNAIAAVVSTAAGAPPAPSTVK